MHLKRMQRKYDFDLLKGLEESFLWTKSSGVLTEVAICPPGDSQLPSRNVFILSFRKAPITMHLLPHSVPSSELVCLQNLHQQV